MTITTPLTGTIYRRWAGTSYDQAVTLCNKFKISMIQYEDMKGTKNAEIWVVWGG